MNEIIDYTKYHFAREEDLMEEYEYPDLVTHKAQHNRMIERVNGLVQACDKGEFGAIESLLEYLKSWLVNHIEGTDQEYSGYLVSKGVT